MNIRIDDLTSPVVQDLLRYHLAALAPTAPVRSRHALDLSGLQRPDVTFWCVWDGDNLAGFGALKELDQTHGEIKSMRTAPNYLRRGVASLMLQHLINVAYDRGYQRLSLETGAMAFFAPAHNLYKSFGFVACEPFGAYHPDPNSIFMTKMIEQH